MLMKRNLSQYYTLLSFRSFYHAQDADCSLKNGVHKNFYTFFIKVIFYKTVDWFELKSDSSLLNSKTGINFKVSDQKRLKRDEGELFSVKLFGWTINLLVEFQSQQCFAIKYKIYGDMSKFLNIEVNDRSL